MKYYIFQGPINWFLSLQIWKILGKLTFTMYLVHLPAIYIQAGVVRNAFIMSYFEMVSYLIFSNVLTMILLICFVKYIYYKIYYYYYLYISVEAIF